MPGTLLDPPFNRLIGAPVATNSEYKLVAWDQTGAADAARHGHVSSQTIRDTARQSVGYANTVTFTPAQAVTTDGTGNHAAALTSLLASSVKHKVIPAGIIRVDCPVALGIAWAVPDGHTLESADTSRRDGTVIVVSHRVTTGELDLFRVFGTMRGITIRNEITGTTGSNPVACVKAGTNGRLITCGLDGGTVVTGTTWDRVSMGLSINVSGVASDFKMLDTLIEGIAFGIFKSNGNTSTTNNYVVRGCECRGYIYEGLSPNSPSGPCDNWDISYNRIYGGYGEAVQEKDLPISLASVTNARVIGNMIEVSESTDWYSGGIHAEENCTNLIIANNNIRIFTYSRGRISCAGIQILPNTIGGPAKAPSRVVIANNVITCTNETRSNIGIDIQYVVEPIGGSAIELSGNVTYNCKRGLVLGSPAAPNGSGMNSVTVSSHTSDNCDFALYCVQVGAFVEKITARNCDKVVHGVSCDIGEVLIDGGSDTPFSVDIPITLRALTRIYPKQTIAAATKVSKRICVCNTIAYDAETVVTARSDVGPYRIVTGTHTYVADADTPTTVRAGISRNSGNLIGGTIGKGQHPTLPFIDGSFLSVQLENTHASTPVTGVFITVRIAGQIVIG